MSCKFINPRVINVLVFAVGAAVGSAVTWKVLKTKYERIAQEEIDSTKEAFFGMLAMQQEETDNADVEDEDLEDDAEDGDLEEHPERINWSDFEDLDEGEDYEPDEEDREKYARLVDTYTNEKGGAEDVAKDPYVISPYDFGELDDYNQIELTYYEGDDTLEDDEYNIITDRDELIGPKALYTFGEYEDDSVFVRNERLRTDFQILKDYRKYTEARSIGPNRVGDE